MIPVDRMTDAFIFCVVMVVDFTIFGILSYLCERSERRQATQNGVRKADTHGNR